MKTPSGGKNFDVVFSIDGFNPLSEILGGGHSSRNSMFNMQAEEESESESESESDDSDEESLNNGKGKEKEKDKGKKNKHIVFEKGDHIIVKLKHWKKEYKGKINRVKEVCPDENGVLCLNDDADSETKNKKIQYKYDIRLNPDKNEEEYDLVRDVKARYIRLVKRKKDCEDDDNLTEMLREMDKLIRTKRKKGNKFMMNEFQKMCRAKEKIIQKNKRKEIKEEKEENMIEYRRLVREKNTMNDIKYYKKLPIDKQRHIIKELKRVNSVGLTNKPYRISLLENDIDPKYKHDAIKKINMLNFMDPGSGEYYKIKQWVDTFMQIPFGKTASLPVTMGDGIDKCQDFMEKAKTTLDNCVYGLNDAKMQIMQMMGQWIANPESVGSAIAIHGPMGTGKTTLVKEGISKILGRPFAFIALGGATDSSFLEGHSYTYEGSVWGQIIDIVLKSKCMNPVIYFDELDKVSSTAKGEEIIGILTHLTDTTQNSQFHDKYFANIDFDLSKALFIFSYNDEQKVNSILRDRMYRITTKGYDKKEKLTIAKNYLIPVIEKNVKFEKGDVIIPDETLEHIIEHVTNREKGVRNMKRCLEIIYTKLNLYRLMKPDSTLFEKSKTLKVSFPYTVKKEVISKLVTAKDKSSVPFGMYM